MQQPGDRRPAPPLLATAQDLANTIDLEQDRDSLLRPAALTTFAAAHGLAGVRFGTRDLVRCRDFREALRDVCSAHTGPDVPVASAQVLADELGRAPLILDIDTTGAARVMPAPGLRGADALIGRIAANISAAVADGTWSRLKACDNDVCRWVFYDHSPAGRGRWCTMQLCGSRAKLRNYRSRRAGR